MNSQVWEMGRLAKTTIEEEAENELEELAPKTRSQGQKLQSGRSEGCHEEAARCNKEEGRQ
jgi:hypothetical protein